MNDRQHRGGLSRRQLLVAATVSAAGACYARLPAAEPTTRPAAYRPFKADSYWNTPIPADAPIDADNDKFIADFKAHSGDHLKLVLSEKWSNPVYWAKPGDREFDIQTSDGTFKLRIPGGAYAATGSDSAMTVIDEERRVTFSLHHAKQAGSVWTADGVAVYYADSNGLEGRQKGADEARNFGHRGIPPTVMMIRKDEIEAGAILHKLEMFAHATGDSHYFPMVGHEKNKGGLIPEGMLLRIKPAVKLTDRKLKPAALIVARSLQTYGIVVGDNSGSGNNLKVERAGLSLFDRDDLAAITWDDWEVIRRGYGQP